MNNTFSCMIKWSFFYSTRHSVVLDHTPASIRIDIFSQAINYSIDNHFDIGYIYIYMNCNLEIFHNGYKKCKSKLYHYIIIIELFCY